MIRKIVKKLNSSGKAECDICKEIEFLEEHHIRGRNIPDFDRSYNKCSICSNCHTKVHRGVIIIEDWRLSTIGAELIWHWSDEHSQTGNDAIPHLI